MEVYIDDMVMKSKKASDHVEHLRIAFEILDKFNMKLNPTKCTFGVSAGKFPGYIVTQRGIEASPKQFKALLDVEPPKTLKEIQKLTDRVAALNRFICNSSVRCKPFCDMLRKNKTFAQSSQHEHAFADLKTYLAKPPVLAKVESCDTLYLYLSVAETNISAVLAKEVESQ